MEDKSIFEKYLIFIFSNDTLELDEIGSKWIQKYLKYQAINFTFTWLQIVPSFEAINFHQSLAKHCDAENRK